MKKTFRKRIEIDFKVDANDEKGADEIVDRLIFDIHRLFAQRNHKPSTVRSRSEPSSVGQD